MKTVSQALLLLFFVDIFVFSQVKAYNLPVTWKEDSIQITIHGVFRADKKTKEGWIGKDEEQYKLLITYANMSKETYEANMSLFEPTAGVGYLKIETLNGAVYEPKYTGGSTVFSPLKPLYKYTTHNYAFNIPKGELPVKLLRYHNRDLIEPTEVFFIKKLISPPIPKSTRIVPMGSKFRAEHFEYHLVKCSEAEYVIKGPYNGGIYFVFKPKNGYKFALLTIEIINKGNEVKDAPLYNGDGDFFVVTDIGDQYEDISPYFTPKNNYWVKNTMTPFSMGYPILKDYAYRIYPRESEVLVKAFEIPDWSSAIEFSFRLLGEVEEVIVKIE